MSYSATESLGFIWIPTAGGGTCSGGVYDDNDGCCPKKTWERSAYIEAKGLRSLQYWNEKRVRAGLNHLISPYGDYPSRLEAEAWDSYASLQPGFLPRLRVAQKNFLQSFPKSRWFWNKNAVEHECASDGYFSVWSVRPVPATEERARLLSRLIRENLTVAQIKTWAASPPKYRQWAQAAEQVINSVPSSWKYDGVVNLKEWVDNVGASCGAPGTSCRLVPSEWTRLFMDLFAPTSRVNISQVALRASRSISIAKAAEAARFIKKKRTIKTSVAFRRGGTVRLTGNVSDDDEQPKLASSTLIVAGVAAAGVAAYLALRK